MKITLGIAFCFQPPIDTSNKPHFYSLLSKKYTNIREVCITVSSSLINYKWEIKLSLNLIYQNA